MNFNGGTILVQPFETALLSHRLSSVSTPLAVAPWYVLQLQLQTS